MIADALNVLAKIPTDAWRWSRRLLFTRRALRAADHYRLEEDWLAWRAGPYCPRCLEGEGKVTSLNRYPDAAPGMPELICPVCRMGASVKPGGGYERRDPDSPRDLVPRWARRDRSDLW